MYGCGGGECGDDDLLSMEEHYETYPSYFEMNLMCRKSGIMLDNSRTIYEEDAWEYFYELLSSLADTMTKEQLYESLASYLNPVKIEEHLNYIKLHKRKTA